MQGGVTLCALGEFAANPVLSTVEHFLPEYEEYIRKAEASRQAELAREQMHDYTRASAGEFPELVGEGGA